LKRVREMLPQRLNFVAVDPGSALALVAETRAKFTQAVPEATGNMPWPQFFFFVFMKYATRKPHALGDVFLFGLDQFHAVVNLCQGACLIIC
jgi:hypothetical protein